jgi:hypothetical protein
VRRDADGTLPPARTRNWPEQTSAVFRRCHPRRVRARDDALRLQPVMASIVAADLHALFFPADRRIIRRQGPEG